MKKVLFLSFLLFTKASFAQSDIAAKMAETIMKTYPDSMVVMKYVSHLVQDGQLKPGQVVDEKTLRNRPANWNYEIGVVLAGFEKLWRTTGDYRYFDYTKHIIDHFVAEDGTIRTYNMEEYNLDMIPTGRQLLTIHQTKNEKKYRLAADLLKIQLDWQPRNASGGMWHKLKYPTQMWLDGLYMAGPFSAKYAAMTGNTAAFDDIIQQFVLMEAKARDASTGLLYHGWDESKLQGWANKKTGQSPEFWSRAMGWYMMALVDVLDEVPTNHPRRNELISILNRLSTAIVKVQDANTGVWWQVTNKGGQAGNYLESSGSAMFVYGLAKSIRMGYISDTYLTNVQKGFAGLQKEFIETDADGLLHFTKAVGGAGLGGNPYRDGTYEYYTKEPTRKDDLKAIGPLMQACVEMELLTNQIGKNKVVMLDNYFNNEYRNGLPFHYLWDDNFDSGYAWFGSIFKNFGAKTSTLSNAPSAENLKNADVYIIVDPDTKKETTNPNFIDKKHVATIKKWVENGGTLLLLANDTANCETVRFNELTKAFGISFSNKSRNMVKNDNFEQGKVMIDAENEIFKGIKKVFIKEYVTLNVTEPAKVLVESEGDVVMATAKVGKGKVFVLGDPWLYNEYTNGRKLPAEYENFKAMKALAAWLLKK